VIERLMILDGVCADRSVTWLGPEREKRRFLKQHLGDRLPDDEYPRLVFGKKPNMTVRYFPDKLRDLATTQRYMHLSPAALDAAIRLLETGTDTSRVAVEK
jgi:hypothetical protein